MTEKRAAFIDRDGVINRKMPEGDYVKRLSEFTLLPGVPEAFKILKQHDFLTIVVTNQRCVALGLVTEEAVKGIHEYMVNEIRSGGGDVDAIYFCPHDNADQCECRKPRPGLILRALDDFRAKGIQINLVGSFMIGDSKSDIAAGKAVGLRTIKIGDGPGDADAAGESLIEGVRAVVASGRASASQVIP